MSDTLSSMRELSDFIQKVVDRDEKGGLVSKLVESVEGGDETAHEVGAGFARSALAKQLAGLDERLRLTVATAAKPTRDDMLELLKDPLSSETRAARRNLGALAVLALLFGVGGRAPKSVLGLSLEGPVGSAAPWVLGAVILYEFVAFKLYVAADVARRKINEETVRSYRGSVAAALGHFLSLRPLVDRLVDKLGEGGDIREAMKYLGDKWGADVGALDVEFRIQESRRRWDEHVPTALFITSMLLLMSMLRVLWSR